MQRPARRNALDRQLDADLRDALAVVARDEAIRAVVLTGAGGAFCAGADLSVLQHVDEPHDLIDHVMTRYRPLVERLMTMEKPVLAAVAGAAAGAGLALALACDLRILADDAALACAFSNIGFVPDSGASWLLARQVGYSRAFELAATAARVGPARAVELGLANRVVPAADLQAEALTWAKELAARPTRALALTKRALQHALDAPLAEVFRHEAELQAEAFQTHDHREGVAAFLQKRPPTFEGR
jgi:2-(1,2-epoxy-1,2-dihydrophenyl)acetyl-CoA isomerase